MKTVYVVGGAGGGGGTTSVSGLIERTRENYIRYLEVVCVYEQDDEEATEYAISLEDGLEHWPVPKLSLAPSEVCGTV